MRVVQGRDEARRTVLVRRSSETNLPEAVTARLNEVFGPETTPEEAVRRILHDVESDGDQALRRYNKLLDDIDLSNIEVPPAERQAAREGLAPDLLESLEFAADRIRSYHEEQMAHAARSFLSNGRGQLVKPIERAGVYAPGTTAVYPSSVLMTVIPARAAGVAEVILATPPAADGRVAPLKLAAAEIAGVDRVVIAGGAQAIAALAFGTQSVPRVDKVFGPGGLFVTLAKQMVYGHVGVDSIYGPSETIVIADETADPSLSAADLLAQAEHDELATPILLATSGQVVDRVLEEIQRQLSHLSRGEIARAALDRQGGAAVVASVEDAIELANEFAPEHLCLNVRDAERFVDQVRHAGAVFIGERSPEAIGDYTAGPSHVMPTGRAARYSGALGVHDFLKVTSVVKLDGVETAQLSRHAARIARAEGFDGHAAAIERRLARERLER
jgi:histidinol dehydrogenase